MKQIKKILLVILVLLCVTACGKSSYKEISYQTFLDKMEKKETFILYIGSSTCSACSRFQPTLEKVIQEYHINVDYIDISKLTDEEMNEFGTIINFGNSTPKVYFIKEGEYSQYNAIKGAQDYDYVVSKMEKNGYIKK